LLKIQVNRVLARHSRRSDRVTAQAIIQVTAKAALLNLTTESMIGRGDEAYVYLDRLCPLSITKIPFLFYYIHLQTYSVNR